MDEWPGENENLILNKLTVKRTKYKKERWQIENKESTSWINYRHQYSRVRHY